MKIDTELPPKRSELTTEQSDRSFRLKETRHETSGGLFPLNSFTREKSRMGRMKKKGKMLTGHADEDGKEK